MQAAARVQTLLEQTGALKSGHFLLSSGLHSDRYCQCASLFEHPAVAAEVASIMAAQLPKSLRVDVILTPAIGGILWGYELARELNARSLFAERKPGEPFELRRGFALQPGQRVLLAEDVVTTGKSVLELVPLVGAAGGEVVAFASVADRSRGRFRPRQPFFSLITLDFPTWDAAQCPLCRQGIPLTKPGSRVFAAPGG